MFGWKRLVDDCGKAADTYTINKDKAVNDLGNGFLRYGCTNLIAGFVIGCVGPVVFERVERYISKKREAKKNKELEDTDK
jgi:hypothetical protein